MKQAQSATIDLLLALGLLIIVAVITSTLLLSTSQPPVLSSEAQALAGAIFTPYPTNWTQETVIRPGFVVGYQLQEDLFSAFQELDEVNYLLGINNRYFINTTLGSAGTPPDQATNVYTITRYAAHQGNITPVEVVVWND